TEVVAFHEAILDAHVASDLVERKTFTEQILKVEGQAALERLQRQHAEQLAESRIELGEVPRPGLQAELAGQRRIIELGRISRPCEAAPNAGRRAADRVRQAEARQIFARIPYVEVGIELGRRRSSPAP